MKKHLLLSGLSALLCLSIAGDLPGRGFGGGGGGRGGFGGGGGGRSFGGAGGFGGGGEFRGGGNFGGGGGLNRAPSVGRPSWEGGGGFRPSGGGEFRAGGDGLRPGGLNPGGEFGRGGAGEFRPGQIPSRQGLQNFLDLPGAGGGGEFRPGWAGGGIPQGGAAAEFLHDHPGGFNPAAGIRPGEGGSGEFRPGGNIRPGQGGSGELRPGGNIRPGQGGSGELRPGTRPGQGGAGERWSNNHPNRFPDRNQWNNNRQQRRDQIAQHWKDDGWRHRDWYNRNWWDNHRSPWNWNHPWGWYWGWGAWGGLASWIPWGWSQPVYYNYGDNVYYDDGSVYYGDQAVCTQQEYADQAQQIVSSVPQDVKPTNDDWMSLGVFAVTQDGQASGSDPNMYIQLAVSKQGILAGTYQNTITGQTQNLEGMVDKKSQRAAWTVTGQQWPVMETGIYNLTQKSAPMLVHFSNGQTQQWLMVHVDKPEGGPDGGDDADATPPPPAE